MTSAIRSDSEIDRALRDVAGQKAKGQQIDTPRFHPFPARMPVSLASHLIESITESTATILDPMVGSGTTVIAAKNLGRTAIGMERDPLALLLAKSEIQNYRRETLLALKQRVAAHAQARLAEQSQLGVMRKRLPQCDQDFIRYWFPPCSQKELFALATVIQEEPAGPTRNLAWVVFSSLIIAKSAGASFALDISRSRPHKRTDKDIVRPLEVWDRRFLSAINRLPFVDVPEEGPVATVKLGDARSLGLPDASVDMILTSPPYLNAIDYMRAHKFSLVWMGHGLEPLSQLRGTMIGTERGLASLDGLPLRLEERLTDNVSEQAKRNRLRKYFSDMGKALSEMGRVLRPGGVAVLVLGPTMINASRTDAADIVSMIAQPYGLRAISNVVRHINATRRSLPLLNARDKNAIARRMRREVLVAFRKEDGSAKG